jgi:DHA2 family multidrug resistance protein
MAVFMIGVVVAPAMGPVLGGYLTDTYGWPWIFYINLPVGIVSIVLIAAFLPESEYVKRGLARIDVIATVCGTRRTHGMVCLHVHCRHG